MKKLNIHHKSIRKLSPSENRFASLARSIIYQQLSGKAAASIEKKFLGLFKTTFPKPEDVLKLSDVQFQSAGISAQKRGYLRDLALKFLDGTIEPKKFSKMSDEDIREHLIRVKGIGRWTADMFLMFALNRLDVLPLGDLGIKKGFQKAFKLRSLPDERKMLKLAEQYAGERTQLSLYLWHILDNAGDTTW
jgi:DNA-3-methyladenine glycosylase II